MDKDKWYVVSNDTHFSIILAWQIVNTVHFRISKVCSDTKLERTLKYT